MLQAMRENASSWIIKILLLTIVIAFVFMGLGSYQSQKATKIAVVNDQIITIDEYRETYNNLLQQVRQRFGSNLNDELLKMMNLKTKAIDQLIEQALILQEAEKLNLMVTDEELTDIIQNLSVFQKNDSFSVAVYEKRLRRVGTTPEQFEEDQRKQMLANKLRQLITDNIKVSETEARQWYDWENAQVNINAVRFDPADYKDIHPEEDEIKTYFEENKNNYKTDPKVKVRYVHFSPDNYKQDVQITDDEIKEYYDNNLQMFATPKTVEARHILIKVSPDADPAVVEEAKQRTIDILKKARDKKNSFSDLAKKYSEGPSKDKGGYLGKFVKEAMVKPFSEKAFSMNPGEISDPVRTNFGWHIINVENVNEASTKTFIEAEKEIRDKLTDEKTKYIAYDEAESFFDSSFEGDDLVTESKSRGITLFETDFFTRKQGPNTKIDDRVKFINSSFDLPDKEISEIIDMSDGFYLLQVIDKIPQKVAEFQTVAEKVTADLIAQIKNNKALEDAEKLMEALNKKEAVSMADATSNNVIATGFFKRNDQIPQIGYEEKISKAAFLLSKEKKWPEKVIKGKNKYYVIEFNERKVPEPEGFVKEKEEIIDRLAMKKKTKTFDSWLSKLKAESEITLDESFQ